MPAVLKGPGVSEPLLTVMLLTAGAPGSALVFWEPLAAHMPLRSIKRRPAGSRPGLVFYLLRRV